KWFRGSLVGIELGITLRSLAIALELFGIPAEVSPPGITGEHLLTNLGLPAHEWSLPLRVHPSIHRKQESPVSRQHDHNAVQSTPNWDVDPILSEVVRTDREQPGDLPTPLGSTIPPEKSKSTIDSWADLFWR